MFTYCTWSRIVILRNHIMNVDMPTRRVWKAPWVHIKWRDAGESPCARAPFYMSQDRIHFGNVAVLQLLELRIAFITF